jgi:hypothetical protein
MPAAALSTSKVVPLAEAWAAKGIGGGKAGERYTRATSHLTAMADQTVARASKLTDDSARGKVIANGFDAYKASWIKTKNNLFGEVDRALPGLQVSTPRTSALLDDVLKDKAAAGRILQGGPVEDAGFFYGLWKGLAQGPVAAKDLRAAIREIDSKVGNHADPFAVANQGLLRKLSATLDEEYMAGLAATAPKVAAKLQNANRVYADGIGKINSAFGEQIHKYAEAKQYDKIAQSIANSRMSVDDIPRIMEVAGKEGTEGMRASVLADLVSRAKNTKGELTPDGLGRAIKTFGGDRLAALLQPEQMAKIRDLATLSGSLQKGTNVIGGSQTMFLGRYGSVPAGLFIDPVITLSYIAGDVATNKFIASRVGQRWLTTGYQPFTREAMTRGATRAAHAATLPLTAEDPE